MFRMFIILIIDVIADIIIVVLVYLRGSHKLDILCPNILCIVCNKNIFQSIN